uniref:Dynactin subunit 4 n=1 Tax=Hucho hucho TaxID=62062 RepID=A0A4W5LY26_9TELE
LVLCFLGDYFTSLFFCVFTTASGGWQEPDNPHTQRINKLIEYYQQLAQREKLERDRKKLARRRPYMPLAFSVQTHTHTHTSHTRTPADNMLSLCTSI